MADRAEPIKTTSSPTQNDTDDTVISFLQDYEQALEAFEREPNALLIVLIARDRLNIELRHYIAQDETQPLPDKKIYQSLFQRLLQKLEPKKRNHTKVLIYQHRLNSNLDHVNIRGDSEALRAERAGLLDDLNRLSLSTFGTPFTELADTRSASLKVLNQISSQLIALDQRLRKQAFRHTKILEELPIWRSSYNPDQEAWWWRLDEDLEAKQQAHDLPWRVLAATLATASLTLSVEIIRRLWVGTPDIVAIFGTILTILLTASPFLKQGPELAQWLLRQVRWLHPRFHGEAMAGIALLSFTFVLALWLCLPVLGIFYNNIGYEALTEGRLTDAEQLFQQASALNAALPVPYYNLAEVYEDSGFQDNAIIWYAKSIEHDRRFRPAYYRIGYLYNRDKEFEKAERILLSGLNINNPTESDQVKVTTDYMLLSNLGWTLYEQGAIERAQNILLEALAQEPEVDQRDRQRFPHYYLAQIYCRLQKPEDAVREIEATLRFGDPQRREYTIWQTTVNDYLKAVKAGTSPCNAIPALYGQ